MQMLIITDVNKVIEIEIPFPNVIEIQDVIKTVFKFDLKSFCWLPFELAWQRVEFTSPVFLNEISFMVI